MLTTEAIENIKNIKCFMHLEDRLSECKFDENNYIALDMAIEALEREKKINEIFDRISKKSIEELSDLSWQEKIVGLLHMVMGSDREVDEKGEEDNPMQSFLGYMKNLYLQNKGEVDKIAKEIKLDKEVTNDR